MRTMLWVAGVALILSVSQPAGAYQCRDGQMPAPPEIAAQMALPLCGFAATKRWGPNGCQLCDARNMHPNPFEYEYNHAPPRRGGHPYRDYQ